MVRRHRFYLDQEAAVRHPDEVGVENRVTRDSGEPQVAGAPGSRRPAASPLASGSAREVDVRFTPEWRSGERTGIG